MQILYAVVSRSTNVLAEYTCTGGNFPIVTRIILGKIPPEDGKMSYAYDSNGITFLCMTDQTIPRRIVFAFLDDIIRIWRSRFTDIDEQNAIAFSLNEVFAPILQERLECYDNSTSKGGDSIERVKSQIESVKEVMIENIDVFFERGEKIELLVDKTDALSQKSFKFVHSTRALRRSLWYRNMWLYLFAFVTLAIIAFVVAFSVCGLSFDKCSS